MNIADAKKLIATAQLNSAGPQRWVDLGCGSGLFSKALLSLLPDQSILYAIDKRPCFFDDPHIHFLQLDFEKEDLPVNEFNGILMANSLHFIKDKSALLQQLKKHLLPDAVFLLVEYDRKEPNRWVPYPLDYSSAVSLFGKAGYHSIQKINELPSVYNNGKIYSACIY